MSRIIILTDRQRGSYNLIGGYWKEALTRLGHEVQDFQTPGIGPERDELARTLQGSVVFHNTLGDLMIPFPGSINIALPGHEWDRYPARWAENLSAFDEVWTYSNHVAKTLMESGVTSPVIFLPPPLDQEPVPEKTSWEAGRPIRFLSAGEAHFRKGFHLLFHGFMEAFPAPGTATLTVKTSPGCNWVSPREDIEIIARFFSRDEMLALYREHDGYVTASLGEGLDLPVAEAVRAGLPVSANHWGGHTDLLNDGAFFPIPFEVVDQPFSSNPEYYAVGQRCALSRPASIACALREMAESTPEKRKSMALAAKAGFGKVYSGEAVLGKIEKRLGELSLKRRPS